MFSFSHFKRSAKGKTVFIVAGFVLIGGLSLAYVQMSPSKIFGSFGADTICTSSPCGIPQNLTSNGAGSDYTGDYPDQISMFTKVTTANTLLTLEHRNHAFGLVGGRDTPSFLEYFKPAYERSPNDYLGTKVRLKIIVPPGVNVASFYATENDGVSSMGACSFGVENCPLKASLGATIWPLNTYSVLPTITPDVPQYVELTIASKGIQFMIVTTDLQFNVSDPVKYETWRSAQPWASQTPIITTYTLPSGNKTSSDNIQWQIKVDDQTAKKDWFVQWSSPNWIGTDGIVRLSDWVTHEARHEVAPNENTWNLSLPVSTFGTGLSTFLVRVCINKDQPVCGSAVASSFRVK